MRVYFAIFVQNRFEQSFDHFPFRLGLDACFVRKIKPSFCLIRMGMMLAMLMIIVIMIMAMIRMLLLVMMLLI